jgi:undecaprenyl-diphosphatase
VDRVWEFDLEVFRIVHHGWSAPWLDSVFWVITSSGLGYVQILAYLIVTAVIGWPKAAGDRVWIRVWNSWKQPSLLVGPVLASFLLASLALSGLTKRLLFRERPSNLAESLPQEGFLLSSFPSGHTTSSFAIAFMVLLGTWKTPYRWVGWVLVGWAALVGISRIYRGVHWPSDVLAGMLCGWISAWIVELYRASKAPIARNLAER